MRRPIIAGLVLAAVAACTLTSAYAETPFARPPAPPPPPLDVDRHMVMQPLPRFEVIGDEREGLQAFMHEGKRFVMGTMGERYRIHLMNPTPQRVEAVL